MRERSFFGDFSEAGMNTFNRIRCVHDYSNGTAIVKQLFNMSEVSFSDIYCTRILIPAVLELSKAA